MANANSGENSVLLLKVGDNAGDVHSDAIRLDSSTGIVLKALDVRVRGPLSVSGSLSAGATSVASLSAGSGSINTTGNLSAGTTSLGQTSASALTVSGATACSAFTSISTSPSDVLFARSSGGGDKYVRVRGSANNVTQRYPAQLLLENDTRSLARVAASAFDAAGTDGRLILSVYKDSGWVDVLSARSSSISILVPTNFGDNGISTSGPLSCGAATVTSLDTSSGQLTAGSATLGATSAASLSVSELSALADVDASGLATMSGGMLVSGGSRIDSVYTRVYELTLAANPSAYSDVCTVTGVSGARTLVVDIVQSVPTDPRLGRISSPPEPRMVCLTVFR